MTETTPTAPATPAQAAPAVAPGPTQTASGTLHLNKAPAPATSPAVHTDPVEAEIREAMTSEAYKNTLHPEHKAINEKVTKLLSEKNAPKQEEKGLDDTADNLIDAAMGKKLAGKFDTPEQLEKSYLELEKKMRAGDGKVPETYQLDKLLKDAGLQAYDPTTHSEHYKGYDDRLKKLGVTSEQMPGLVEIYKDELQLAAQELAKQYGPVTNIPQERAKLEQTWGASTQAKLKEVGQYAQNNLPPSVYRAISKTAEGVEWLYSIMEKGYGPQPMRSQPAPAPDPLSIGKQLKELISSPAYRNIHNPENQAVTEKVKELLKMQSSLQH